MRATAGMRIDVQSQYVESWVEYHRGVGSPKNARSLNREATEWFEKAWASVQGRVRIVPGKDALHAVNSLLQDEVGITLTTATITEAVTNRTASEELKSLVRTLDDFRSKD